MQNVIASTPPLNVHNSRVLLWTGRVLTGLVAAFLMVDAAGKLFVLQPVLEGTQKLGYGVEVIRPLGVVLTLSTLLHLFRRTELFGAVLLTAYLGGATATHVRTGTPFWFAVAMGVVLWIAYFLRRPHLRALFLSNGR